MAGYWRDGQWIAGTTLGAGGKHGHSGLVAEVTAAYSHCLAGQSEPLSELKRLLSIYPVLRLETQDSEEHPLSPLARLYADSIMNTCRE